MLLPITPSGLFPEAPALKELPKWALPSLVGQDPGQPSLMGVEVGQRGIEVWGKYREDAHGAGLQVSLVMTDCWVTGQERTPQRPLRLPSS